jgi:hypothetical protein
MLSPRQHVSGVSGQPRRHRAATDEPADLRGERIVVRPPRTYGSRRGLRSRAPTMPGSSGDMKPPERVDANSSSLRFQAGSTFSSYLFSAIEVGEGMAQQPRGHQGRSLAPAACLLLSHPGP